MEPKAKFMLRKLQLSNISSPNPISLMLQQICVQIRVKATQLHGEKMKTGKNAQELWNKQSPLKAEQESRTKWKNNYNSYKQTNKKRTPQGENSPVKKELSWELNKMQSEKLSLDIKSEITGDLYKNPFVLGQYLAGEWKPHYIVWKAIERRRCGINVQESFQTFSCESQ